MIDDNDIKKLKTIFATKDDFKRFATKDDLRAYATKEDLKAYATKKDLEMTEMRLNHRMDNLEETIKENTDQSLMRFRSDIVSKLDQVISEIVKSREEQEVLVYRVGDHEDRLGLIEKRLEMASE